MCACLKCVQCIRVLHDVNASIFRFLGKLTLQWRLATRPRLTSSYRPWWAWHGSWDTALGLSRALSSSGRSSYWMDCKVREELVSNWLMGLCRPNIVCRRISQGNFLMFSGFFICVSFVLTNTKVWKNYRKLFGVVSPTTSANARSTLEPSNSQPSRPATEETININDETQDTKLWGRRRRRRWWWWWPWSINQ